MTALLPACPNQVLPGPSGPDGHKIARISPNAALAEDGAASISASFRGMGTNEDENEDAPGE